MNAKQIIKALAKDTGITAVTMSRSMGKSDSYIANTICHAGITLDSFQNIVNAYGYDIIVKPKKSGRKPDGAYLLGDDGS